MIVLLVILNLLISTLNAWSVGRSWAETKTVGGWARFMSWMGAIMAACGFTWCFTAIVGGIVHATGYLDAKHVNAIFSLGYLAIIIPALGSGLAITIDTWAHFWRQRTFGNGVLTAWNTFAQVSNTIQALSAIPRAIGDVGKIFDSDDDSNPLAKVVVALVAFCALAGILTTIAIIRITAKRHAFNVKLDYFERMEEAKKASAR